MTVITSNFLTLLTFGVVSPPVAVASTINIVATTTFWRVFIGRFCRWSLSTSDLRAIGDLEDFNRLEAIDKVESSCSGLANFIQKVTFNILAVSAMFYTFIVTDQVLDREELSAGVVLLALSPLSVPLVYHWIVLPLSNRAQKNHNDAVKEFESKVAHSAEHINDSAALELSVATVNPIVEH